MRNHRHGVINVVHVQILCWFAFKYWFFFLCGEVRKTNSPKIYKAFWKLLFLVTQIAFLYPKSNSCPLDRVQGYSDRQWKIVYTCFVIAIAMHYIYLWRKFFLPALALSASFSLAQMPLFLSLTTVSFFTIYFHYFISILTLKILIMKVSNINGLVVMVMNGLWVEPYYWILDPDPYWLLSFWLTGESDIPPNREQSAWLILLSWLSDQ